MKRHFHLLPITACGGVGEGRVTGTGRIFSGLPYLKGLSVLSLQRAHWLEGAGRLVERTSMNRK